MFTTQMSSSSRKRTAPIPVPLRGAELVTIEQHLELIDVFQQLAQRLDKIEEALIDTFPVMQNLLGDPCEEDSPEHYTSDDSSDSVELVDLTGCDNSDYDPKRYYI